LDEAKGDRDVTSYKIADAVHLAINNKVLSIPEVLRVTYNVCSRQNLHQIVKKRQLKLGILVCTGNSSSSFIEEGKVDELIAPVNYFSHSADIGDENKIIQRRSWKKMDQIILNKKNKKKQQHTNRLCIHLLMIYGSLLKELRKC